MPNEEKKQLRKTMLARRERLSAEYMALAGSAIQAQVVSLPQYQKARSIFLYVSTEKEPSTRALIQRALDAGKAVYVPKCVSGQDMLAARIHGFSDLAPGRMGILEPEAWTETGDAFDLILVPCVAASRDGKRLGHGAGYYDRFLAGRAENAVCLCFREMLCETIPVTETDVTLPAVITEDGIFSRKND